MPCSFISYNKFYERSETANLSYASLYIKSERGKFPEWQEKGIAVHKRDYWLSHDKLFAFVCSKELGKTPKWSVQMTMCGYCRLDRDWWRQEFYIGTEMDASDLMRKYGITTAMRFRTRNEAAYELQRAIDYGLEEGYNQLLSERALER